MSGVPEFPLNDTLNDTLYRVTGHYMGTGAEQLHFGIRAHRPGQRYLISVTQRTTASTRAMGPVIARKRPPIDGVFQVEFIGPFDQFGVDRLRDAARESHWGMVEALPAGGPVAGLGLPEPGPARVRTAIQLGAGVGAILLRAARSGLLVTGVRPEYVWAEASADGVKVTGVGGANADYFAIARPHCMATHPLFEREYIPGEVMRAEPASDRSLSFILAVMVAEWATGVYPFPDSWERGNSLSLALGKHAPLAVPPPLEKLLASALVAAAARRPPLADVAQELHEIARRA